jgi:hypothetical protein
MLAFVMGQGANVTDQYEEGKLTLEGQEHRKFYIDCGAPNPKSFFTEISVTEEKDV